MKRALLALIAIILLSCKGEVAHSTKECVDYVNPYMGNISHLLVPTFPTTHLPNSMLRVFPRRGDFSSETIAGLPLAVTSHRSASALSLSPMQGDRSRAKEVVDFTYDREKITPYSYSVVLDEKETAVSFAPSHQSALYKMEFSGSEDIMVAVNAPDGEMNFKDGAISGYQKLNNGAKVYIYMESDKAPTGYGAFVAGEYSEGASTTSGDDAAILLCYGSDAKTLQLRYGISFISCEQAKKNLEREQSGYNMDKMVAYGRDQWNKALGSIEAKGCDTEMNVFYTSLYRCMERPIAISEDGSYYSGFDGKVHSDEGTTFYTDDWIWDTYRATHPLRILIDSEKESDIINSYLRMAKQMGKDWLPTFPGVTGDAHCMNSNHGVATMLDAYSKGLRTFDLEYAYKAAKGAIEDKTLAPWSNMPAGKLDQFYKDHGYFPALRAGERESAPEVHHFEQRQPIAVTLGTSYDHWCLSKIAEALGKKEEAEHFAACSFNYRNVFHPETHFFHPKDGDGKFVEPMNYNLSGGLGARHHYDENNAWVYRWDVPHNIPDLVELMGGKERFAAQLDSMYRTPIGMNKFEFYSQLPDHTGNVGQFSMANEPSLHIPYLYNYAGMPWKTQKRIRTLIEQWFRDDVMGVPGDEDGGGMSAFVVFSSIGFYPVTPGEARYSIGTPLLSYAKINLSNGKTFEVVADGASKENKYIISAVLNGKPHNSHFINHEDIACGGQLVLTMGSKPNREWGIE